MNTIYHLTHILDVHQLKRLNHILTTTYTPGLQVVPNTPTPAHHQRLKHIYAVQPQLCIPRDMWTTHENWSLNKQMTQYHMPIRRLLHKVVCGLCDGYATRRPVKETTHTFNHTLSEAYTRFQQFECILHQHAEREETHLFRKMSKRFADIDFNILCAAHREIDSCVERVDVLFKHLTQQPAQQQHTNGLDASFGLLLVALLELHTRLMDHLNEEEDILVPMSLVQPDAMHDHWPFSPDLEDDTSGSGYPHIRHRL